MHHTDSGPGGKRYNVLGVTSCNVLQPPLLYCVFEGTLDTALFEQFVVSWLGRGEFFPGDVLVIDNATVHARGVEFDALRAHFAMRGVSIVPLPVYSELNPIELIWRGGKQCLPAEFKNKLTATLTAVTHQDVYKVMKKQGYFTDA